MIQNLRWFWLFSPEVDVRPINVIYSGVCMRIVKLSVGVLPILFFCVFSYPTFAVEELTAHEATAKYNEALIHIETQKYPTAIDLLSEIIESGIEDKRRLADAHNMLGFSYRKSSNINFAIEYYREALNLNPDHKGANEYIGEAYLEINKPLLTVKHLKILKRICGEECREYQKLKKSVGLFLLESGTSLADY